VVKSMTTVASYGGGVNSTAMLIGMQERGERVDLILFADTGGEVPETYSYVQRFSKWLVANGMPEITPVWKTTTRAGRVFGAGERLTLEQYCLGMGTLPSIAYGMKSCSLKFKREPQDKYIKTWAPAIEALGRGEKLTRLIGFDAGEPWRAVESPDEKFTNRYPLIEWGWDREECVEAIIRAGLCVPPKSSCFFCPNMKEIEILQLRDKHPELLERALTMEKNAPTHGSIRGLGRDLAWSQIIQYDADQMAFLPPREREMPCECYDGE